MSRTRCVAIIVRGIVQGAGFCPFVYRTAMDMGVLGDVSNTEEGVMVRLKSGRETIERFCRRMMTRHPPLAIIASLEEIPLAHFDPEDFRILKSRRGRKMLTQVPPDLATCQDCLREIFDPSDRHFGYAFTNCTNCGPRYTIIEALPYPMTGPLPP